MAFPVGRRQDPGHLSPALRMVSISRVGVGRVGVGREAHPSAVFACDAAFAAGGWSLPETCR